MHSYNDGQKVKLLKTIAASGSAVAKMLIFQAQLSNVMLAPVEKSKCNRLSSQQLPVMLHWNHMGPLLTIGTALRVAGALSSLHGSCLSYLL